MIWPCVDTLVNLLEHLDVNVAHEFRDRDEIDPRNDLLRGEPDLLPIQRDKI
jgi:hypothetical protein